MIDGTFYSIEDLKEEFLWLKEFHFCRYVGFHPLFHCLAACPYLPRCHEVDPRLKGLKLKNVLKPSIPVRKVRRVQKMSAPSRKKKEKGPAKIARAVELLREGKSAKEIMEILGCSYAVVYNARKRLGG